ncbi:MAG: type III pantothenate kinase [Thermodesulfovibrio sp.]|nr:type III pantothenate kinase [Thermodesulfovibrio sp.]
MLIAVKIGNSTTNFAFFENPADTDFDLISFETKKIVDWQKELQKLSFKEADCIVSSVVPSVTKTVFNFFKRRCKNLFLVDSKSFTGLTLKLKKPHKFGSDRLCSAVAAYELYRKNVAVIDAGTATTITVVTKNAEVVGGAIMPGVNSMNEALSEKTANLHIVELKGEILALGKDTDSAIKSGVVLGSVFAIEGLVKAMQKELGVKLSVVLTGGHAELISKYMTMKHSLNRHLVIEGMRLIYLKNIKKGGCHEN